MQEVIHAGPCAVSCGREGSQAGEDVSLDRQEGLWDVIHYSVLLFFCVFFVFYLLMLLSKVTLITGISDASFNKEQVGFMPL